MGCLLIVNDSHIYILNQGGNLRKAVLEYDNVKAESWARKAVEEGI